MRRKIVQQGPSTLMVSLPSKWVHKFGLNKGDELEIEEFDSGLILKSEKAPIKITIDADSFSKLKEPKALLRVGVEKIEIKCRCGSIMKEKTAEIEGINAPAYVCTKCGFIMQTEEHKREFEKIKQLNAAVDKVRVSLPNELKDKKIKVETLDSNSFRIVLE